MEGGSIPSNLSLFLILLICIALDIVDIIELSRIKQNWSRINNVDSPTFERCIKDELVLKTTFSSFSFLAALSATLVISFLLFFPEFFIKRILKGFLNMNYFIFGLYMLGFSLFFTFNWQSYTQVCTDNLLGDKVNSLVNCFSIVGCLVLSIIIVIGFNVYETFKIYSNSINKSPNSIETLRKAFWWAVFKGRGSNDNNRNNNNHNANQNNEMQQNPPNIANENNNNVNNNNDDENDRLI